MRSSNARPTLAAIAIDVINDKLHNGESAPYNPYKCKGSSVTTSILMAGSRVGWWEIYLNSSEDL